MRLTGFIVMLLVAGISSLDARAAENYKVDPVHATVIYRIAHFGIGNAYGRFNEPTGNVAIDEDAARSSFNFEVQTDKLDTANPKRDKDLKGPDFFNSKQFPAITFKSTKVSKPADNKYEVSGDLTLHGVTRPITFTLEKTGEGDGLGSHRTGWQTELDLKRSDFGMTGMQGAVGDDVHLIFAFEAIRQ